jgi:integrase
MPSLTITTRQTKSGPRYVVRFRLGGRAYPIQHGGSFKTLREAKARRDLIGGELAAGRNPAGVLRALLETPAKTRTVAEWGRAMVASRLDVSENRLRFLNTALRVRINPAFGERAAASITAPEVQEWVAAIADELAPRSVLKYWQVLVQVLEYADVEEVAPPSSDHFLAIVEHLSPRLRLPAVFLEQTAARVAELRAWEWQDVDLQDSRIRSRGVKGRRGTRRVLWRQVPPWLMEVLLSDVSPDDRTPERKLFMGVERGNDARRHRPRLTRCGPTALLAARSSPPSRLVVARLGNTRTRAGRADGSLEALDEPRRLQPRDAARRGCKRATFGPDRALDDRAGVVPVWSGSRECAVKAHG